MLALGCGPGRTEDGDGTSGTASTGNDTTTGGPPASLLDQCDAPAPCDSISRDPGSNNEAIDAGLECAIEQAIATATEGVVAGLSESYCDIGCVGTDLLLGGGATVYLQSSSTTDVTSYEEIQSCTLRGPEFFEGCQGQPFGTNDCASFSDWVMDCEVVETVSCP